MNQLNLLDNLQATIIDIYNENDLECLRGLRNRYEFFGKQILVWYSDATRKVSINNTKFDRNGIMDDLLFISDEIIYFTAHLYLYAPYLNDPIKESYPFAGRRIYPNYENFAAKRFYMYADVVLQKIFNYWDRIGHIIAAFYPKEFKKKNIHFTSSIDVIEPQIQLSESYKWLKKFRENDFRTLNRKRKNVVHKSTTSSTAKYDHLKITSNKKAIELWMNERNDFPNYCKNQIEKTLIGFKHVLELAEILSNVKLGHIK